MVQRLRGRVALHLSRSGEAAPLLRDAAQRLDSFDPRLARDTHLEALYAASIAGRLGNGMLDAATAARRAPAGPAPPRAVDLLLDGLGLRYTDSRGAAGPMLKRALCALVDEDGHYEEDMRWPWLSARVAADLLDDESGTCSPRAILRSPATRGRSACCRSPSSISQLRVFEGELDAAAALIEDTDSIIDAARADGSTFRS